MNFSPNVPTEVFTNPEEKLVIATTEVLDAIPQAPSAFQMADQAYEADPESYLQALGESVFSFRSSTGATVDCSLIPGKGSEILVIWAPFSDSAPNSSADALYSYIQKDKPGLVDKIKGAPNSWNQLTKSSVIYELLKATDNEMPVLTIFSPLQSVPHNVYTNEDYQQIRHGDFSPAGWLAFEAMQEAQDRLHGLHSETRLEEVHGHGASLGASTVIGMANTMVGYSPHIKSVTAQELIVAPKNVFPDLAARFTVRDVIGEESDELVAADTPTIEEPLIRRQIDRAGNEPAMFVRMLQGMSKVSRLKGLTRPGRNRTPLVIERLLQHEVSVLIPLAENSGLTHDTSKWLPGAGEQIVNVRATEGQRAAHLIDEHVGLTALLAVAHVAYVNDQAR